MKFFKAVLIIMVIIHSVGNFATGQDPDMVRDELFGEIDLALEAEDLYRQTVISALTRNIIPGAGNSLKKSRVTPRDVRRTGVSELDQIRRNIQNLDRFIAEELYLDTCRRVNEIMIESGLGPVVRLPESKKPQDAVYSAGAVPEIRIISPPADTTVSGKISVKVEVGDDTGLADVVLYADGVKQQFKPLAPGQTRAIIEFLWDTHLVKDGQCRIGVKVYERWKYKYRNSRHPGKKCPDNRQTRSGGECTFHQTPAERIYCRTEHYKQRQGRGPAGSGAGLSHPIPARHAHHNTAGQHHMSPGLRVYQ